jgi:hypothetical protein
VIARVLPLYDIAERVSYTLAIVQSERTSCRGRRSN